jgi:uncharacterized membrane protein YbhN (UPF0104 family)
MSDEYRNKIKPFLERKLQEYTIRIKKVKKRRRIIKGLFITFIVLSMTCSTVCAALMAFVIPPFVISVISTGSALTTAISLKFNLKGKN